MAHEPDEPAPDEDRLEGEPHHDEERPRTGLRRRLHRLLDRRELAEDTREVLGGMLEMSDRAKTEAVRLVAREARNYLDELKIKEDLLELVTSHSLEVNLSLHLKPLSESARKPADPGRRRRKAEAAASTPAQAPSRRAEPPASDEDPADGPEDG